ncbi:hypothetical protein HY11_11100 [Hyphomonas pacifica]|nr:hypothetical protein HY11_11100 [Hyphomonas pacifica]
MACAVYSFEYDPARWNAAKFDLVMASAFAISGEVREADKLDWQSTRQPVGPPENIRFVAGFLRIGEA